MFIMEGTEFYYANRNTKKAEKCVALMVRMGYPDTVYAQKENGETFQCSSDFGCFDNIEADRIIY